MLHSSLLTCHVLIIDSSLHSNKTSISSVLSNGNEITERLCQNDYLRSFKKYKRGERCSITLHPIGDSEHCLLNNVFVLLLWFTFFLLISTSLHTNINLNLQIILKECYVYGYINQLFEKTATLQSVLWEYTCHPVTDTEFMLSSQLYL